jgi:hypothetical protein
MRFTGQSTHRANHGRPRTRVRALTTALIAVLGFAAADVRAESAVLSNLGSPSAAAGRIGFTIVIPAVLILDRRTGTFYTNDAKAIVALGTMGSPRFAIGVDREISRQAGLRPVTALNGGRAGEGQAQARGASGIPRPGHPFHDGEVICIP